MAKKASKKGKSAKKSGKLSFADLKKNRFFAYVMILLGGLTLNTGVLIIGSSWKKTSFCLITIGALLVIYALHLIVNDDFRI